MIDYYDPNIRMGVHTVRITFMLWDYVGHIAYEVGGNTRGTNALKYSFLDEYTQDDIDDLPENDCQFAVHDRRDSPGDLYYTAVLTNVEGDTLEMEIDDCDIDDVIVCLEIVKYERGAH